MSPSSLAGTWWKAAATRDRGTAACTLAATEPRGGTSGWNSWPTLARALAMEITILPASGPATDWAVAAAASHGVAITTRSAVAAPLLSASSMARSRPSQRSHSRSRTSRALYLDREPSTTSNPTDDNRAASELPAGPVAPSTPMRIGGTVVGASPRASFDWTAAWHRRGAIGLVPDVADHRLEDVLQ